MVHRTLSIVLTVIEMAIREGLEHQAGDLDWQVSTHGVAGSSEILCWDVGEEGLRENHPL